MAPGNNPRPRAAAGALACLPPSRTTLLSSQKLLVAPSSAETSGVVLLCQQEVVHQVAAQDQGSHLNQPAVSARQPLSSGATPGPMPQLHPPCQPPSTLHCATSPAIACCPVLLIKAVQCRWNQAVVSRAAPQDLGLAPGARGVIRKQTATEAPATSLRPVLHLYTSLSSPPPPYSQAHAPAPRQAPFP